MGIGPHLKLFITLGLLASFAGCAPDPGSKKTATVTTEEATDGFALSPDGGYIKYTSPTMVSEGYFGIAMTVGDFNGDGYADLAAGVPFADLDGNTGNTGGVLIYYGSSSGWSSTEQYYDLVLMAPNTNNNEFGSALATYDLDGDSYDDLVVGAPGEEPSNRGAVYVFYGDSSGLATTPSQILGEPNSTANSGFGRSITVTDFDGDGYADLLVGSYLDDTVNADAGAAWIFEGLSSGIFSTALATQITVGTAAGGEYFGNAITALDYNNDGNLDLIVGAPLEDGGTTSTGFFHVYHGTGDSSTWVTSTNTPDVSVENPLGVASDYFGYSLQSADITGDGKVDLLVGVPLSDRFGSNQGLALLYDDIQTDVIYDSIIPAAESDFTSTYAGYGLAIGDANNDGELDVLFGTPLYSNEDSYRSGLIEVYNASSSGMVYFSSPDTLFYPYANESGTYNSFENYFGSAVCTGDVNGDGYDDLIVGSYNDETKWSNDGVVHVYYSRANNEYYNRPDQTLTSGGYRATGKQYGASCLVMDYDGDGNNDLLVGAIADDIGGSDGGAVFIHFGTSSGLTASPTQSILDPGDTSNGFGKAIAVGDINNDGFNDLAVGAYLDDTGGSNRGIVYVFESDNSTGIIDLTSSTTFQTVTANTDYYGYALAIMDYDGDGDKDLLVGVPGDDTQASASGRVVVYTNAGTANTLLDTTADSYIYHPSNASNAYFGSAILSGLYSLTTYPDLLIGSEFEDTVFTDGGGVYIYQGSASGPSSSATQQINALDGSNSTYEGLGSSLGLFDFNRDGQVDLAIGAYLDDESGRNAGSVYVKVE